MNWEAPKGDLLIWIVVGAGVTAGPPQIIIIRQSGISRGTNGGAVGAGLVPARTQDAIRWVSTCGPAGAPAPTTIEITIALPIPESAPQVPVGPSLVLSG